MDFFENPHRERIEKELRSFLPAELTANWAEKAVGKAKWKQDVEALTKAISEPVWDFLSRGGKRWRPMLMLMCCEAVGGKPSETLPFAVIPELIHNGSLIVDDIEDNSDLRRGKPVLHRIFGVDIAVNAGNVLYFLPLIAIRDSDLPEKTKSKAYETIITQLLKCHLGQATDIYWHSGKAQNIPTEKEYLQMCANKTGSVACMAAKLGALLGGGSEKQIGALGEFAEAAGVAFQIKDDILNVESSEGIGKEFGDDISEGKRTLMVIHTLNTAHASATEKKRLLEILNLRTKDKSLIAEAIAVIKKHGSIDYARKTALQLLEEAWQEADKVLPESEVKNQMKGFAQLLINRSV
ncbi:polyprenyl synthetase family protein [Candidatus Woesearchaeota archaeon]|nr:polyprenyl synthetase family protein [Candidatus Woesearchaeota archaeon]